MTPANVLLLSIGFFVATIIIGLKLNYDLHGAYFALSPLMYLGLIGVFLGVMSVSYTHLRAHET